MPPRERPYTGPVVPIAYDPTWQSYTNLNDPPYGPATILVFQAFPQDLIRYASTRRWLASLTGTSVTIGSTVIPLTTDGDSQRNLIGMRQAIDDGLVTTVPFVVNDSFVQVLSAADAKTAHQAVMTFMQQLFGVQVQLVMGINATPPTITTRKQIDVALAAVAPNSPSATNPSPT